MENYKKLKIFLFFLMIIFSLNSFYIVKLNKKTHAFYNLRKSIKIELIEKEPICLDLKLNKNIDKYLKNKTFKEMILCFENIGCSDEEILKYIFCEDINKLEQIVNNFYLNETEDILIITENSCELEIKKGQQGVFIDKQKIYNEILDKLKNNQELKINLKKENFKYKNLKENLFLKKGEFKTNFSTSSRERKNNIKLALSKFDGIVLEPGEILSFNKTTGERTKENGYEEAKIISGGTFVEGYGGGVCQVSTTIYNAAVLAGLEIVEVHNHSLPVLYVEPSFDAMVNSGNSDLKIKNNLNEKIIFTTSSKNDICKVVIFGEKNKLKIKRKSEKLKMLPASEEKIIETDYKKYGYDDFLEEEKIISIAKDGFVSNGYLEYYDENGNFIKKEKVRETRYNPTKTVVLKKVD